MQKTKTKLVKNLITLFLCSCFAAVLCLSACDVFDIDTGEKTSGKGPDAFVVNEKENTVYINDGTAAFTRQNAASDSLMSTEAVMADFDQDGDLDAFVVNYKKNNTYAYGAENQLFANDGGGTFITSKVSSRTGTGTAAALGDFDGDGIEDVFVGNENEKNVVYFGTGVGSFTPAVVSPGAYGSWGADAGDLDGDGDDDLFVVNVYNAESKIYINDGTGSFTLHNASPDTPAGTAVELGDLDNDGDLDAFQTNNGENYLFFNDGSGNFTRINAGSIARSSEEVALGDIDSDGDLDAFVVNSYIDTSRQAMKNRVYINLGNGEFSSYDAGNNTHMSYGVDLADLDGDNDLDAFIVNSDEAGQIYTNDGSGNFTVSKAPGSIKGSFNVVLRDFASP